MKSGDLDSVVVMTAAGAGRGAAVGGGPCWEASAATTGAAAGAEAAGAARGGYNSSGFSVFGGGDARFQVCLAALT